MLEEAASGDVVVRPLQLEQEGLAVAQDPERPAPRLRVPEVDLVHILLIPEEMEPVRIGTRDVRVHPDPSTPALPRTTSTGNRSSFSSIFRAIALPMSIPITSASLSR